MRIGVISAAALVVVALGAIACTPQKNTAPEQKVDPPVAKALKPGQAVYKQWCLGCHGPLREPDTGGPAGGFPPAGTLVLEKRYKGTVPSVLTERTDLTGEYIRHMVRNGRAIMPPTRKSELTDKELDALVAYLIVKSDK